VIFVVCSTPHLYSSIVVDSNDLHWQEKHRGVQDTKVILQQVTSVTVTSNQNLITDMCCALFLQHSNARGRGGRVRDLLCLLGHDHGRGQGCDGREQTSCGLARVLDENLVNDDQSGHSLDDGDSTGDDAGIVPSASGQGSRGSVVLGGFLRLRDCGWGFEADPEVDVLSVGDTTLDASAPVC